VTRDRGTLAGGRRAFLLVVALMGSAVAAYPILENYFVRDDFGSFYEVANFGPWGFIVEAAAGHMEVLRNTVLYLWFLIFRLDAVWYLGSLLVAHLVNVLLLFVLVRRLTGSAALACFGALLFGVSPMNAGTLGWYAVSGHALAATLMLGALLLVVPDPEDRRLLGVARAAGAALCMLAASQSFGTGAAAALAFPLVAVFLRPSIVRRPGTALVIGVVPLLVLGALFAIYGPARRLNPMPVNPSQITSSMVWSLADPLVRHMLWHISALGLVSLVLGPAYALTPYPTGALPVMVLFGAGVVFVLVRGTPPHRRAVAAFLLLALACYISVAAGRAVAFSLLRPDDLVRAYVGAPRYHYLAQVALAVLVSVVLADVSRRVAAPALASRILLAAWVVWSVAGTVLLRPPMDHYDQQRAEVARLDGEMLRAVRAEPPGATVCIQNANAPTSLATLAGGFPGSVGVFVMLHPSDVVEGRRVRYVSSDPAVLARRADGGRLARLLVPPAECSPANSPASSR
jgi:hypothetical protein